MLWLAITSQALGMDGEGWVLHGDKLYHVLDRPVGRLATRHLRCCGGREDNLVRHQGAEDDGVANTVISVPGMGVMATAAGPGTIGDTIGVGWYGTAGTVMAEVAATGAVALQGTFSVLLLLLLVVVAVAVVLTVLTVDTVVLRPVADAFGEEAAVGGGLADTVVVVVVDVAAAAAAAAVARDSVLIDRLGGVGAAHVSHCSGPGSRVINRGHAWQAEQSVSRNSETPAFPFCFMYAGILTVKFFPAAVTMCTSPSSANSSGDSWE
uniref:Uncharacterized protein n=1 Tax=Anopheles farauti TaxID=69004 RepID=A0A182Q227_9DIPT